MAFEGPTVDKLLSHSMQALDGSVRNQGILVGGLEGGGWMASKAMSWSCLVLLRLSLSDGARFRRPGEP